MENVPAAVAFDPGCTDPSFPSPGPTTALGIDGQCGINGNGTKAEGEQNAAKNNFCAGGGTPQPITIAHLRQLQDQVVKNGTINFGDGKGGGPAKDRDPLRQMGEGKLVTIRKAYVFVARQEGG